VKTASIYTKETS